MRDLNVMCDITLGFTTMRSGLEVDTPPNS